jgi:mannose-1-phosphate guanylyltransferase
MLELTLNRLDGFIPPERRIIVTHIDQIQKTRAIAEGKCGVVLGEPMAKNTAPALALAALEIEKRHRKRCAERCKEHKEPIMISLHADSIIRNTEGFLESLERSISISKQGYLTLIGIPPTCPETGYGYLEKGDGIGLGYRVSSFKEKPGIELAKEYCKDPNLYWNSGIFVWKTNVFLAELTKVLPIIVSNLEQAGDLTQAGDLAKAYENLPKISVDHSVLETSDKIAMTVASFDWQDVGSWDAILKTFPTDAHGNGVSGEVFLVDTTNSLVESDGPLVACLGIKDMVVVVSQGAVLVCPVDRCQDIKVIVEGLNTKNKREYT